MLVLAGALSGGGLRQSEVNARSGGAYCMTGLPLIEHSSEVVQIDYYKTRV